MCSVNQPSNPLAPPQSLVNEYMNLNKNGRFPPLGTQFTEKELGNITEPRWTYNQLTGQLRDPHGNVDGVRGYSGAPGYINDPDAEGKVALGPTPRGTWRIASEPHYRQKTGHYSIWIKPDGHNAAGRDVNSFYIHGANPQHPRASSEGCPIFTLGQRQAIFGSNVKRFDVVDEDEW